MHVLKNVKNGLRKARKAHNSQNVKFYLYKNMPKSIYILLGLNKHQFCVMVNHFV
jgi:hypothetical protein